MAIPTVAIHSYNSTKDSYLNFVNTLVLFWSKLSIKLKHYFFESSNYILHYINSTSSKNNQLGIVIARQCSFLWTFNLPTQLTNIANADIPFFLSTLMISPPQLSLENIASFTPFILRMTSPAKYRYSSSDSAHHLLCQWSILVYMYMYVWNLRFVTHNKWGKS